MRIKKNLQELTLRICLATNTIQVTPVIWQVWKTPPLREPRNGPHHLPQVIKLRKKASVPEPLLHHVPPSHCPFSIMHRTLAKLLLPAQIQTQQPGGGHRLTGPDDIWGAVGAVWNRIVLGGLFPSFSAHPPLSHWKDFSPLCYHHPPLNDSQISTSCFGGMGLHKP